MPGFEHLRMGAKEVEGLEHMIEMRETLRIQGIRCIGPGRGKDSRFVARGAEEAEREGAARSSIPIIEWLQQPKLERDERCPAFESGWMRRLRRRVRR